MQGDYKTIGYFFPNTVTGSGTEPVLFWIVSLQEGMERGNKEMSAQYTQRIYTLIMQHQDL